MRTFRFDHCVIVRVDEASTSVITGRSCLQEAHPPRPPEVLHLSTLPRQEAEAGVVMEIKKSITMSIDTADIERGKICATRS